MKIRRMTIADYDAVYQLWLNTPGMGLNDRDDSRGGIDRFLKRNPNTCFIAEKDGQIIGVILGGNDGRRGYIHHTSVDQKEQQQGIGTALVDAVMEAFKKEGISKVAFVVFDRNEKGNAFWEKRNFHVRRDLVYRDQAIYDVKRIDT